MELYTKYLPLKVEDYYLHPELQDFLSSLKTNKNIPNLILYGQEGAGKKSFLSVLFPDKKIKSVKSIKYNSKTIDYTIYNSNFTIEIDSKELKIYNKYLLQNIIKNIAETKRVNDNKQKIIIIHNAHYLDKEFQYILRKMIELYINNAIFILVTKTLTKIINPIKSRCLCIRIKNPTYKDIDTYINDINKKENLKITKSKIKNIVKNSNRNLKKAILDLETYTYQNKSNIDNKINISVNKIVSTLKNKNFNLKLIEGWETKLYKLIINFSIEDKTIINLLFKEIIDLYPNNTLFQKKILEITCEFDEKMTNGSKSIIHLNYYLSTIYELIRDFE